MIEIIRAKKCKNPLKMYEHYILPSNSNNPQHKYLENLGYCAVCANRAFEDNKFPTNPTPGHKKHYNNITAGGDLL